MLIKFLESQRILSKCQNVMINSIFRFMQKIIFKNSFLYSTLAHPISRLIVFYMEFKSVPQNETTHYSFPFKIYHTFYNNFDRTQRVRNITYLTISILSFTTWQIYLLWINRSDVPKECRQENKLARSKLLHRIIMWLQNDPNL